MTEQEARAAASKELDPGEELLWTGYPDPARTMRLVFPWFAIGLIAAMAGGYSLSKSIANWRALFLPSHALLPLIGLIFLILVCVVAVLPCVLLILGMLLSPIFAWNRAKNAGFAVTDRRILVVRHARQGLVEAHPFGCVRIKKRIDLADGAGDLTLVVIDPEVFTDEPAKTVEMLGIADVKVVERLIRERQAALP